jgi:fructose 1,6-bisphosphatase
VEGVGITSQQFLQKSIFPLLKAVGTSRREMVRKLHQKKNQEIQESQTSEVKLMALAS